MNKKNNKLITSLITIALVISQATMGSPNIAKAVPGIPYTVLGQVNLDGSPADGASVILTDTNTGATLTDTVGVLGASNTSGWYSFDLNNIIPAAANGTTITIAATINSITATTTFVYDSALNFFNPTAIDIITPAPTTFTITSSAGINGSIAPLGATVVSSGTSSTFTITPDIGFNILDVLVDGGSVGPVPSYTFTNVAANHTIAASFTSLPAATSTIISIAGLNGTINPLGTTTVTNGTSQTYTITADNTYAIQDVLVDGMSVGAVSTYTFANITGDHTIAASFVAVPPATFMITPSAGPNGNISPNSMVMLTTGASSTFTMTPSAGYEVSDVLIDNVSVGAVSTYTFNNVVADHTIAVSFRAIPTLTTLDITPLTASVGAGLTAQFTATLLDQYGAPFAAATTWSSNNTAVATINQSGLATALTAGTTTISVSASGMINSATLTVTPAPVLTSISITPANPTVTAGVPQSFSATAMDQFNNPMPATFAWSSSDLAVGVIDNNGLVTTLSAGTSTITASSGGISGTTLLTVTPTPALSSITVSPATPSVSVGNSGQFSFTALDQFGAPFATTVGWSSSDPAVATINASGLATALAIGTTTITAASGAINGTALLTVTPAPVLTTITVSPATPLVASGTAQQFAATALDQFGATVTAAITWSSSNPAVATIDNTGLASTLSAGTTTITATSGAISGTALLTVAFSTLSPVISPIPQQTATTGAMLTFTATATNPNNGMLMYSLGANAPAGASINSMSGIFTWTPNVAGTSTFDVIVSDGLVAPVSASVTIVVIGNAFPIDNTPPMVAFTSPTDQASGQALDRAIFAVFTNYNIDTAKINSSNFIVRDNLGNVVPATIVTACCNKLAAFVPAAPLLASTTYTVTLTTGIMNLAGTPMAQPYIWSFTTAPSGTAILPVLEFTNPLSGGTNFPVDRMIHAIFNKAMDVTTVNANTYFLKDGQGNTVPVMYMSRGGSQFMLTPTPNLLPNSTYTAYLTSGITDLAGNPIASTSWSFTTGSLGNLHPVIAAIPTLSATVNTPFSYQVTATDPNNDPVSYSLLANAPAGMQINANTGLISWTPATAATYRFDVQASDGQASAITRNVTINVTAASTPPSGGGGGGGGGGFPLPTTVTTTNAPLTIQPTENGILEQTLEDGLKVVVNIPAGAVTSKTTFRVTRGQLTDRTETEKSDKLRPIEHSLFNLTAVNEAGQSVTNFAKAITITVSGVELPSDVVNLSVYAFDEGRLEWLIVPGALFNSSAKSFTFSINHLTLFGIFRSPGLPSIIKPVKKIEDDKKTEDERQKAEDRRRVLGIKIYPDGTLIRGTDNRIYVIMFGEKERIVNMAELSLYRGKPIIRVDAATLSSYDEHKFAKLRNGDLFRGPDNRIYVIKNGKKQHIRSLIELRQYHGKKINNVDTATVAHY